MDIDLMHEQGCRAMTGLSTFVHTPVQRIRAIEPDSFYANFNFFKDLNTKEYAILALSGGVLAPGVFKQVEERVGYKEEDGYQMAKEKYAFDDNTTCEELAERLRLITNDIADVQRSQVSSAVQKKDRKKDAKAEAGYTKFRNEIEEQIKKKDCAGAQRAELDAKQQEQTLQSIMAAQEAATQAFNQTSAGSNLLGGMSNMVLYGVAGLALLGVIVVVARRSRK